MKFGKLFLEQQWYQSSLVNIPSSHYEPNFWCDIRGDTFHMSRESSTKCIIMYHSTLLSTFMCKTHYLWVSKCVCLAGLPTLLAKAFSKGNQEEALSNASQQATSSCMLFLEGGRGSLIIWVGLNDAHLVYLSLQYYHCIPPVTYNVSLGTCCSKGHSVTEGIEKMD